MSVQDRAQEDGVDFITLKTTDTTTTKIPVRPITADLVFSMQKASAASRLGPAPRLAAQSYQIGPGDVLGITVWEHPELTLVSTGANGNPDAGGFVVAEDGTIFFPYVGVMRVAGKTPLEVRDRLTRWLSRYIANLQLEVRIIGYRSQRVYVVGQVLNPGIYPVTDVPITVADAINKAGGVTPDSDLANVTIARQGRAFHVDLLALYEDGDVAKNILLRPGDVLRVPDNSASKVFVLGEVKEPASQIIRNGRLSLAEALAEAGGVNQNTSNPARVFVIRTDSTGPQIYRLDAASATSLILADRFQLMPRDVVYVDTSGVTRWNRVISQILPSTSLATRAYNLSN
jgi:polysaccharide export outer membrane protein